MNTCNTCGTGMTENSCISISRVMTLGDAIMFSQVSLMLGDLDITNRCQFSWSADKVNWSCWANYNTYINACQQLSSDYYLRILFRESTIPTLYLNNISNTCFTIAVYYDNPFLADPCSIINSSGFDLYCGWDCAMLMQQQLSDQVICMVGIPIYYFRVTPDVDTKSYTFKEYVLHNVESVKQIKMIFPDGQMPSSKPTISDWDMEFEVDWETELSKTQFATAFGTDAFPKQRDFIWVPMQQRMYMVNTAYEEKNENLMWRAVTWKLSLVKWQEQNNIAQGDFEDIINKLIVNKYSDVFEIGEKREGELTGMPQIASPQHEATNLYSVENSDYIRKAIKLDTMRIEDSQLNHGNIIVAKNKYVFYDEAVITYQKKWCGENGTMSLIFEYPNHKAHVEGIKPIISLGDYVVNFEETEQRVKGKIIRSGELIFGDKRIKIDPENIYLLLVRWGRSVGETTINIYKYKYSDTNKDGSPIPFYKRNQIRYVFDFNGEAEHTSLDNRLISNSGINVELQGYPLYVYNLKLYNRYIDDDHRDEILKYATKDEYCIINDQARPLNTDHGYNVR